MLLIVLATFVWGNSFPFLPGYLSFLSPFVVQVHGHCLLPLTSSPLRRPLAACTSPGGSVLGRHVALRVLASPGWPHTSGWGQTGCHSQALLWEFDFNSSALPAPPSPDLQGLVWSLQNIWLLERVRSHRIMWKSRMSERDYPPNPDPDSKLPVPSLVVSILFFF